MTEHPLILHLETATNVCSVAVSQGEKLLALRESNEDRSHGALLTVFMDEVMKEAGLSPGDIHAIAVSKGPGSYTGLRIGVSATKGFAYARNIPVIGIITLQSLAVSARKASALESLTKKYDNLLLCPMIDARRMEVYTAMYDLQLQEKQPVSASVIDEDSFSNILKNQPIAFFGNGSEKARKVIRHPNANYISAVQTSAKDMIPLALEAFHQSRFEDTAYFEPFYLKDFIATIPKRKVL